MAVTKFRPSTGRLVPLRPEHRNEEAARKLRNTSRWRQTRAIKLASDPLCERCNRPATQVHHRAGVAANPELALVLPNLESLCVECHEKEHGGFNGTEPRAHGSTSPTREL